MLGPVVTWAALDRGADIGPAVLLATVGTGSALTALLRPLVRERRRLTTSVETRDSELVTILDGLPLAVMLRAADGTLLHANPGAERFVERLGVGVSHIQSSPKSLLDYVEVIDEEGRRFDPDELPVVSSLRDGTHREVTLGYALPEGGYAWYAVRAAPVSLSDGTTGTVMTCDDVTERHEARQELLLAERALRRTFDHAPVGIAVIAPDCRLLQVNPALCALLGSDEEALLATGLRGATDPDQPDDDRRVVANWFSGSGEPHLVDRYFRHSAGHWVFTQVSVAVVRTDDGAPVHLIAQVVDLSDRRALEKELRATASKDPLTGLANRRGLREGLVAAQQRRSRHGGEIGLLFLDLDHFKEVNDRYGHEVGDAVLIETGTCLVAATRDDDTVCRLGGDEFVILCEAGGGSDGLQNLVRRITSMPAVTVPAGDTEVTVRYSVGWVTVASSEGLDAALRRADAEMYRAKRRSKVAIPSGADPHPPVSTAESDRRPNV